MNNTVVVIKAHLHVHGLECVLAWSGGRHLMQAHSKVVAVEVKPAVDGGVLDHKVNVVAALAALEHNDQLAAVTHQPVVLYGDGIIKPTVLVLLYDIRQQEIHREGLRVSSVCFSVCFKCTEMGFAVPCPCT